ncbi:solute carrier organic anion transporter family member 4C1-like [Styela clava]
MHQTENGIETSNGNGHIGMENKSSNDGKKNLADEKDLLKGEEDEGDCGLFCCVPKFLQFFNNPSGYLLVFGMFLTTQGLLVNGYMNVILTTLERRFRLQSSETGLIVVSYDIAYFVLCLFVTFYGNRAHRPRLLAIGSIFFGVGCLIFAIPHFTTGRYVYEGNVSDLCDPEFVPTCESSGYEENVDDYLYLFIFAMVLQGFGCIPLYTVGFAVLEDSLPKGKSAIYIGVSNALTILGPVLGYILGGYSLSIYVDFDTTNPEEIEIDSSDPRWVGAWWLGFLLASALALIFVSLPMISFPKQFPGSALIRSQKESEVHRNASAEITEKEEFGKSIKDMPIAIVAMLKNSAFLFTTLAGCSEGFLIAAFTAFLPKFIESQFNLSAGEAALYAGIIAIPGGVFGNIISALLVQKLKLKTAGVLKMCIFCAAAVFVLSPTALLHCKDPLIAGVNQAYSSDPDKEHPPANLTASCNSNCNCQEKYFSPVCGADNQSYFSACLAGCFEIDETGPDNIYRDCSCVQKTDENGIAAVGGLCEQSCTVLAPFLGIFFVIVLINFMTTTPALLVILRIVPDSQKSFAVGVQWWIVRAFGSIPGPVVFGVIFDITCLLWQQLSCGLGTGSCWLHNSDEVALYLTIASMVCKAISVCFFSLALYLYKPPTSKNVGMEKLQDEDFELDANIKQVDEIPIDVISTPL